MDKRSVTSAENGKKGGRPKGSRHKPKITDHMTQQEAEVLLAVSLQKAMDGSETMMKFLLEQFYGKAMQRTELTGEDGANLQISFDNVFKNV